MAAPKTATIPPNIEREIDSLAKVDKGDRSDREHSDRLVRDRESGSPADCPLGPETALVRMEPRPFLQPTACKLLHRQPKGIPRPQNPRSHHGATAKASKSIDHREWDGGNNSERDCALASRWRRHADTDQRAHVGIHLTHCGRAQSNLTVAAGQLSRHRREEQRTTHASTAKVPTVV